MVAGHAVTAEAAAAAAAGAVPARQAIVPATAMVVIIQSLIAFIWFSTIPLVRCGTLPNREVQAKLGGYEATEQRGAGLASRPRQPPAFHGTGAPLPEARPLV